MKKLFLLLSTLLSLSALAQYSWSPLPAAPKSFRLDDIYFLNPQKGWAISPCYQYLNPYKLGQIYGTNNGGTTWQLLKDTSKTFFRSIGFADSLTGWVGNLADTTIVNGYHTTTDTIPFYKTTDGGITWNPVTNIPDPRPKGICGISVVTDSIIYAYGRYYGPPVLIKTVDKGNTWTSQDMSAYASGLVDAHFFNKDTGFVTGCYDTIQTGKQKALILSTFDGGVTWQVRHQSTRINEEAWKIVFPSRKIGYASIENQGTTSYINTYFLKTTDGGITWTDMPFLAPNIYYDLEGIGFINDTIGWIGGDCVKPTYKTTNGGNTWAPDLSLGTRSSYYECSGNQGIDINRFRRFGDTLMYASGYTVCKLSKSNVGIETINEQEQVLTNYPNPFSEETTISFSLSDASNRVSVEVFNTNGEKLMAKNLGHKNAGSHQFIFNLNLPTGIYYYTLSADTFRSTKKMIIIK